MKSSEHLSKEESRPYVAPYLDLVNRLIANAVADYKGKPAKERLVDSPRTRSSTISDRILWNIGHCEQLLKDPYIRIKKRYGVVRILIKDRVQVVFKKLDSNLKPSYPSTDRSLNYQLHSDDIRKEFPEIQDAALRTTNVYWGYVWNPLGDIKTPIVCMDGSEIDWYIEAIPMVVEPALGAEQEPTEVTKKVRARYANRKHNA